MSSPFDTKHIASSDMNLNALQEAFDEDPLRAVTVTRYNHVHTICVSPDLWELMCAAIAGEATLFEVPLGGGHHKKVVARPGTLGEGEVARWAVLIDGFEYELYVREGAPEGPDLDQKIWRHHPDVARRILEGEGAEAAPAPDTAEES